MCDNFVLHSGVTSGGPWDHLGCQRLNRDQPHTRPVLSPLQSLLQRIWGVEVALLAALPEVSRPSLSTMEIPALF